MSYQGPQGYRQGDGYDYPVPDGAADERGEQLAGTVGYAELTTYRRAGYAGFDGYGDFQAPPPAHAAPAQPGPGYQPQYPGQPAYQGRHTGPFRAQPSGPIPAQHTGPIPVQPSGPFPAGGPYQPPNAYPAAAHAQPRVAPGRRGNVPAAVARPAPAGATATYPGPDSGQFAAPVINPAPADAPPARDGSRDPTAYAGLPRRRAGGDEEPVRDGLLTAMVTGLLAAAVAISGSVLAAMVLRPLRSPVSAVASILRTTTVANFAGEHFGSREHIILLASPWLISAVVAVIIGLITRRHRVAGVIGMLAFFGAGAAFIVATRPGSHAADVVPSLVGGVAGAVALIALATVLLRPAGRARQGT